MGSCAAFSATMTQLAVLEGDPMAATGDFTIRFENARWYKVPPHTHPHRENVTVISGTMKFGMGDSLTPAR